MSQCLRLNSLLCLFIHSSMTPRISEILKGFLSRPFCLSGCLLHGSGLPLLFLSKYFKWFRNCLEQISNLHHHHFYHEFHTILCSAELSLGQGSPRSSKTFCHPFFSFQLVQRTFKFEEWEVSHSPLWSQRCSATLIEYFPIELFHCFSAWIHCL